MRASRGRARAAQVISLAAAMTAVLAAGPRPAQAQSRAAQTVTSWPQLQGNAAHTGDEASETSVASGNVTHLTVSWTHSLPAASEDSEATVSGGVVYAEAGEYVVAVQAVTGAQLWQTALPGPGFAAGTPSVQGSLVVLAFDTSTGAYPKEFVAALDSSTGAIVWTRKVGVPGGSVPASETVTTTPRRAYVSTDTGQVEALGLAHGFEVWQSPVLPGCELSAPSVAGSQVIVGDGGAYVTALSAATGGVTWSADLDGTACGGGDESWLPTVSGSTVYVGLLDGVAAIELDSGAVLWRNTSLGSVFWPVSVTGGEVIASAGAGENDLVGLSQSAGEIVWKDVLHAYVDMAVTFGSLAWALQMPGEGNSARAVAFDTSSGKRVYAGAQFPDTTQAFPPVVNAGRVFVNTGTEITCLTVPASR